MLKEEFKKLLEKYKINVEKAVYGDAYVLSVKIDSDILARTLGVVSPSRKRILLRRYLSSYGDEKQLEEHWDKLVRELKAQFQKILGKDWLIEILPENTFFQKYREAMNWWGKSASKSTVIAVKEVVEFWI